MKKSILFFLGFSMVSLMYAQHIEPTRSMLVPALKDKITIDGIADETSWSEESTVTEVYNPIDEILSPSDLSGYIKLCWDENNLYVFASVKDDIACNYTGSGASYEYDNFEIFLDLDTTIVGSNYNYDAIQLRFNRGWAVQTCNAPRNGSSILFKEVENSSGWQVEVQVPWLSFMPAGSTQSDFESWMTKTLGFDVQICDNDGFGRDGQTSWDADVEGSDATENNAYFETEVFGLIDLMFIDTVLKADAGPDQTVVESSPVTLDASGSLNNGSYTVSYEWIAPYGITLNNSDSLIQNFTVPEVYSNKNHTYAFKLILFDGINYSVDYVNINVTNINNTPIAIAQADSLTIYEGLLVNLNGDASYDIDGDPLTYYWSAPDEIGLNYNIVPNPFFIAPGVYADTNYKIELVVFDGYAYSLADSVIIKVLRTNTKPVANAGTDQTVVAGETVKLNGSASYDIDRDPLTYHWTYSSSLTITGDSSAPTFATPNSDLSHTYIFILTVNDGYLDSDPDTLRIIATAPSLGIESLKNGNEISVYPNPAKDYLIVELNTLQNVNDYSVSLLSSDGKIIMKKNISAEDILLNLSGVTKGIYFLQIISEKEIIETRKIIIE